MTYFLAPLRWDSVDAAALFDAALVLPSRSTAEAAVAALAELAFVAATWLKELAAAVLEEVPEDAFLRTLDALVAVRGVVTRLPIIKFLSSESSVLICDT